MFQNLIADRRFLATFYTLPTSATLLAKLAAHLEADWGDLAAYRNATSQTFPAAQERFFPPLITPC